MTDAFRDAIANLLEFWGGDEMVPNHDDADAILAMPEMRAIRDIVAETLRNRPLLPECERCPGSVIDWALGQEARREQ